MSSVVSRDSQVLIRTARKRHRCDCNQHREGRTPRHECLGWIENGSRYPEYLGESPAYQSGKRYCLPCATWQLGDWIEVLP